MWFSRTFRRKAHEQRLDAELRFHLEAQVAENIAGGMEAAEARRRAAIEFGGLEQIKEECRDVRPGQGWEVALQDLRYGCRSLRKAPGYTIAALAMIALGIGANTAIFSFIDGVLLRPLPYPDADRIVAIVEQPPRGGWSAVSTLNYLDWAEQNTVFEQIAAKTMNEVSLGGIETPVHLYELRVTADYFDVFRIKPALGRTFLDDEADPGGESVAVLTNKLWVARFGAEPDVVGRKIILDGKPTTVIGVMPPGVLDRSWADIYRPLVFTPEQMSRTARWFVPVYAMLKEGVSVEQARAQMDSIGRNIAADHPASNQGWGVRTMPFAGTLVSDEMRRSLLVLMAAVGMVLLMACANLANLTLARGIVREREVALRAALGASRSRLLRQFLTESLLLSFAGGSLGLLVGYAGIAMLKRTPPGGRLPETTVIEMDLRVLAFTIGLSLVTGLVFGLLPALRAARSDLNTALKNGTPGASAGRGFHWLRRGLIVTEVALAVLLLSGAGLLIRSFFQLQKVDTGFDSSHLATAYLPLDDKRFSSGAELTIHLREVLDRIGALPGVSDVALTTAPPINWGWGLATAFHVVGTKAPDVAHRPHCGFKVVSANYFRTLGMRLAEGRLLDEHDINGTPRVAVISESMARKHFPDSSALGQHILVQERGMTPAVLGPEVSWEVVGIVRDEKNGDLRDENQPGMYVSLEQSPVAWQFLVVRGAINPRALERSMRATLRGIGGDQVMDNLVTFDQVISNAAASDRRRSWMLAIFASVALLLAATGLYGVMAYSVAQRSREIGIRSALGATSRDILWLILRHGMALTLTGLLIGIAGAMGLARVFASLLFNVASYDPATLIAVSVILAVTSLLACILPARRAAKVSPITAMRCE